MLLENTTCLLLKLGKRQKKKTPIGIQNQPTIERLPTPISVGLGQSAILKERHEFQFQQKPNFPSFFSFGFTRSPVARSSFRT
jgi:hypothetical protein